MTDTRDRVVATVADRIQARMRPLFGSPEYLADPVKLARAEKRQRESAESYARIAVEEALASAEAENARLRAALDEARTNSIRFAGGQSPHVVRSGSVTAR